MDQFIPDIHPSDLPEFVLVLMLVMFGLGVLFGWYLRRDYRLEKRERDGERSDSKSDG